MILSSCIIVVKEKRYSCKDNQFIFLFTDSVSGTPNDLLAGALPLQDKYQLDSLESVKTDALLRSVTKVPLKGNK